jgi:hypothetical protein
VCRGGDTVGGWVGGGEGAEGLVECANKDASTTLVTPFVVTD